jgi:hypothetical protein
MVQTGGLAEGRQWLRGRSRRLPDTAGDPSGAQTEIQTALRHDQLDAEYHINGVLTTRKFAQQRGQCGVFSRLTLKERPAVRRQKLCV